MNWPSLSIAFPCWHRGVLLQKTLDSIVKQNYPGNMELIVVEEEDDGLTEKVARDYGARYIRNHRPEPYPLFQSITKLWNMCWHAASHDYVILQCAEVLHKNNVIEELVMHLMMSEAGGDRILLATPLIEDLNEDGSFNGWYSHPTDGSRPGWVSGAGPHAFHKAEMEKIGGYEELFYGYGGEDNYLFYLLRKNGWNIDYIESALCAHQWHERTKYEPTTGYANRSLINLLIMDIEEGRRPPLANWGPLEFDKIESVTSADISNLVMWGLGWKLGETYDNWAHFWLNGERHPDNIFVAQRKIANEGKGNLSQIGEMITESAWAIIRYREAEEVAQQTTFEIWGKRAMQCSKIHMAWASRSLKKAYQLMENR